MRWVLIIGGIWLALVVLAATFQRQMIYLPDSSDPVRPADVDQLRFSTADDLALTAWRFTPDAEPVSTILVAPGNAGNRANREPMARELVDRGHAVVLLDYRGYGGNPGRPSEDGIVADTRAAAEHLVDRDGVDADRLAYLGESIGTSAVAAVAADLPPAALVLRSPFPELADVGSSAYPFLPVRTLLREEHPTSEHLRAYDGPVLVVAGGADRIVPTALSQQVAAEADTDYVEVEGVGHNDPELFTGARFLDAVDAYVRDAVDPAA